MFFVLASRYRLKPGLSGPFPAIAAAFYSSGNKDVGEQTSVSDLFQLCKLDFYLWKHLRHQLISEWEHVFHHFLVIQFFPCPMFVWKRVRSTQLQISPSQALWGCFRGDQGCAGRSIFQRGEDKNPLGGSKVKICRAGRGVNRLIQKFHISA